jgi:hypothetical protein
VDNGIDFVVRLHALLLLFHRLPKLPARIHHLHAIRVEAEDQGTDLSKVQWSKSFKEAAVFP